MTIVFANTLQNATAKCRKIHRNQPAIIRKIIAFQELRNLEKQKKSAREAADLLEVPNSTMQSWIKQEVLQEIPVELKNFLSTPVGADLLQRIVISRAFCKTRDRGVRSRPAENPGAPGHPARARGARPAPHPVPEQDRPGGRLLARDA